MRADEFFTLPESLAVFGKFFPADVPPWEWVKSIAPALAAQSLNPAKGLPPGIHVEGTVFIDPSVKLPGYATLIGPAWIGAGTEIRPGALVRGNVIVGQGCVLGNSCEFKNCLLMDGVQVPHFSYVGDSILGNKAHLGAGVILSNLRLDQHLISLRLPTGIAETGLRKLGAILGDAAEVGCNAVLQPGTLLGKRALVMPTVAFGGYLPAETVAWMRSSVVTQRRRN